LRDIGGNIRVFFQIEFGKKLVEPIWKTIDDELGGAHSMACRREKTQLHPAGIRPAFCCQSMPFIFFLEQKASLSSHHLSDF